MAFAKYAYANIIKPDIDIPIWDRVRDTAQALGSAFATREASRVVFREYKPQEYIFSHCTIVASVDTENGPGALGRHLEDGFTVDRRFQDFYIVPKTSRFVNANGDSWSRPLLLATFRTFVGAENYCFLPGTMIVLGDGTQKAIESVRPGDEVVTHKGRVRKVVRTFEREVDEVVHTIYMDRGKVPVKCTGNHPFAKLGIRVLAAQRTYSRSKTESRQRYRRDAIVSALRDNAGSFAGKLIAAPEWVRADSLERHDFVLGPENAERDVGWSPTIAAATLLGYYLAEGCLIEKRPGVFSGVVLTFGAHEKDIVEHARGLAEATFPGAEITEGAGQGTLRLQIRGPGVGRHFYSAAGRYSHSKKLAASVFRWSNDTLLALLAGWITGDGSRHRKTRRLVGATVSHDLACQLSRICEMVGIKASLWRETVESFEKRARKERSIILTVGGQPRAYPVRARCRNFNLIISADSARKLYPYTPRWAQEKPGPGRSRENLGWFQGRRVHSVSWVGEEQYRGPVYNFEVEDDHSYVLGGSGVAVHNCEHLQIPELSKGKIVDACARDIGDSVYVDILVATHRKHRPLVAAVQNGQLSTLSMGANVAHTTCTKCGNVAGDETQLCRHIKYEKGSKFQDILGNERIVAELCGHVSEPNSNRFIEASWVANPAFKGAVVRNLLSAEEARIYDRLHADRLQVAFSMPAQAPLESLFAKAARKAQFDFGEEQQQFPGGGSEEKEQAPKEDVDPLDSVVKDLAKTLTDRAVQRVRQDMSGKAPGNDVQEDHSNHTLVPASVNPLRQRLAHVVERLVGDRSNAQKVTQGLLLHKAGGWRAVQASKRFSGRDVLAISRVLDLLQKNPSIAGEARIYRTVLAVGGTSSYVDVDSYLAACSQALGREPNQTEKLALVTKGRLFDLGI